jgi:hypothetical protein
MDVAKYVTQEDVGRLSHELENAADDTRRAMLLRLLVEEENKVGLTYEQLAETLRQIGHANQIISTQLEIITMLKAAGHSMERAECSLTNAFSILIAHEAYRSKIEAALSASIRRKQP